MKLNDVLQDAQMNSKFWKLKSGQTLKGYFSGDFAKRDFISQDGKKVVKYEVSFTVNENGQEITKPYSGSSKFFEECAQRASVRGLQFDEAIFAITRNGTTQFDTRYIIDCLGRKDGVPF